MFDAKLSSDRGGIKLNCAEGKPGFADFARR
jgi:hypothetical protein